MSKKKSHTSNIISSGSDDFDQYEEKHKIIRDDTIRNSEEAPDSSSEVASDTSSEVSEESDAYQSEETETDSDSKHSKSKHSKSKNSKSKNSKSKSGSKVESTDPTQVLKNHIKVWLECDTKIKELNAIIKEEKDLKKEKEKIALRMIMKLGMDGAKLDITDNKGNVTARVYKHKSVTKSAIKEELLKDTLMEVFQNEKKVDQIVKKVDSKRRINERFYLKRTKGEGNPNANANKKKQKRK